MKTTKKKIVKILNNLPVYEPVSDSDIEVAATDIINLFKEKKSSKRKQIIWDEKTIKFPFKAAVEAIKHGSHQIEKDCDNLDLLRDVLKEAFPSAFARQSMFQYKYFYLFPEEQYNMSELPFNNYDTQIPIIKLSEIMPKEVKLNPCALCTYETSSRGENALIQLCDYHNCNEVKFSFDVPVAPQVEEKPVELEVGKWYRYSNCLLCYQGIKDGLIRAYGFLQDSRWTDVNNMGNNPRRWKPATTEEITQALKNESIRLGIEDYVWVSRPFEGFGYNKIICLDKTTYHENKNGFIYYEDRDFMEFNGFVVYSKGQFATPIPTITRKEAEEKLNAKILD